MPHNVACAAAGIVLACAAGSSLTPLAQSQIFTGLDVLRLQTPSVKQDRLPFDPTQYNGSVVLTFDLPAEAKSIVIRESASLTSESALRTPRPASIRTVPVVRDVPGEKARKDQLPVGCEPAFSPVTTPAFAHIGVRCDS